MITPGVSTTEWKGTKLVLVIGALLQVLGATIGAMQMLVEGGALAQSPGVAAILSIGPMVLGSVMQVLQMFGYTQARTQLKLSATGGAGASPGEVLNQ